MSRIRWNRERPTIVNTLVRELSKVCHDHLLDEKWVLAPSLRAGHEWLVAVARANQPVVNGHVKTVAKIALDLAAPVVAEKKLELISRAQATLLVEEVLRRLRKQDGYLWRLPPSARLAETVFKAVDAIRRAGLSSEDLHVDRFEVADKGHELKEIYSAYVKALEDGKWIDRAGALQLAVARLKSAEAALPRSVLILVPDDIDLSGLERQLLAAVPRQQVLKLPVDQPGSAPEASGAPLTDIRLLSWLHNPADAPLELKDGSPRIFRAVGEVNEVRGVLRRCLDERIPLDQVELLCTDKATYLPLIYESFPRLAADDAKDDDIPVTFQEGLPARRFRPGRALVAWLAWVRDDFPQNALVQMIGGGLLNVTTDDGQTTSFARLANVLRSIRIGLGRERYLETLDEHAKALNARIADPESMRDEDGQVDTARRSRLEERLKDVRVLRGFVESLLALSPRADDRPKTILGHARGFIENHTRQAGRLDAYASRALIKKIKDVQQVFESAEVKSILDVRAWLSELPAETWVGGEGPRDGRLHVADVLAGGHSGRPHTFIIGFDDGRFPGSGTQDPMLLDEERKRLSPELVTASRQLAKRLDLFVRLLARLRGKVTLSYSCHNLVDDREMFPSSIVLSAFRILSGNREGDHAALNRWLAPAESFAPDVAEKALTESEWWLWRATGPEDIVEPAAVIGARYPHLGRGYFLAAERGSDRFTAFDGWIPDPGKELDLTAASGPPVSASRLETLGDCPLRYFFRYVLEIKPPDELVIDPDVWLDPLARGSLLHEVFERFFKNLVKRGVVPDAKRDEAPLLEILQSRIDHYLTEIPPPSEAVFRREVSQLRRTVRIFLREEELYCRETGNRPIFMEVSIGMKSDGAPTVLDTNEPVEIKLPVGGSLRVRGRIDRIDQVAGTQPNLFAIWDYKTGGTWKFTQEPRPFWAGRVVQHALYTMVMANRLKALPGEFPGGRVERFGYFFPSEKGGGEKIEFTPKQLEAGGEVLSRLATIASKGAFLATNQADKDCNFCDYAGICGDVVSVAQASDRKLKSPSNTILTPYAELRGDGKARDEA
jgi:ATP-dependent helicase/nuclease subunit B